MYQLINSLLPNGSLVQNTVRRLSDEAIIPMDFANTDYQAYLKFLEEGGQPLPAEENT